MGVRGGRRQGQSLRSLRPHIGMCSLNARGKGLALQPAQRNGKKNEHDVATEMLIGPSVLKRV